MVNVEAVDNLGSYIAIIPDNVFIKMIQHPLTTKGIEIFMRDWEFFEK